MLPTVKSCLLFRWTATACEWYFESIWLKGDASGWHRIFGRALGRVLAHEMYHVLAHTRKHGKTGITKGALSALELTAPGLQMDAESLRLIEVASLNGLASQSSPGGLLGTNLSSCITSLVKELGGQHTAQPNLRLAHPQRIRSSRLLSRSP